MTWDVSHFDFTIRQPQYSALFDATRTLPQLTTSGRPPYSSHHHLSPSLEVTVAGTIFFPVSHPQLLHGSITPVENLCLSMTVGSGLLLVSESGIS